MSRIQWDGTGQRLYETGVDRGVLYPVSEQATYPKGVAWNGLTTISESPTGAESNKQYADNIEYLNLQSVEQFGATIEAFTFPDEFSECDGTKEPIDGFMVTQQNRRSFGLAYRSLIGNDTKGTDYGYIIHLIYGAKAAPSSKDRATVNESPEAATMSWEITTTPIASGIIVDGRELRPAAHYMVNSTKFSAAAIKNLEDVLYGAPGVEPRLPLPAEVKTLLEGGQPILVTPVKPTQAEVSGDQVLTIPNITGVIYEIDGVQVENEVVIEETTLVTSRPATGYRFPEVVDTDWLFEV